MTLTLVPAAVQQEWLNLAACLVRDGVALEDVAPFYNAVFEGAIPSDLYDLLAESAIQLRATLED